MPARKKSPSSMLTSISKRPSSSAKNKIKKLTENNINIIFKEGNLNIKIDESLNIFMTGPVSDIKHTKLEI